MVIADGVSSSLLRKIDDLGIDLIFAEIERSGFYLPKQNTIVINSKLLNSHNIDFAIAHELSHCLNAHYKYDCLYNNSYTYRVKMENEANMTAIKILIDIYIGETGLDIDQLNSIKIMDYYGIDYKYIDVIKNIIINYCSNIVYL